MQGCVTAVLYRTSMCMEAARTGRGRPPWPAGRGGANCNPPMPLRRTRVGISPPPCYFSLNTLNMVNNKSFTASFIRSSIGGATSR